MPPLDSSLSTLLALLMVATVVGLVAWALQLMQTANDRKEFALMLAGCMVCSAAVGLATVMVLTLSGPHGLLAARAPELGGEGEAGISLDAVALPWDQLAADERAWELPHGERSGWERSRRVRSLGERSGRPSADQAA
ncbi:hypothetical protein [Cyanobium sp. Morenito 9A2]|uniref:hypothetical protein n=1 Tax=Cyanobium sp. Morenito 9A2 TaxID=2823718 RepID=UPI0020CD052C|nr:hypothetical protein [Cyanobium sp. Morenito 9A2]MCP9851006.1 hypothetical protein [Cyanobium sp. Morenito 9A2]